MSWTIKDDIAEVELLELNKGKCEGPCQREEDVPRLLCQSRRMDSAQEYMLCSYCAEEYEEFWDEMWSMYYSEVL